MADIDLIAARYKQLILNLLPHGYAWNKENDSMLSDFALAIAIEYARADDRNALLLDEADPRTTNELLEDWERVTRLPDACGGLDQTFDERRLAVVQRLQSRGGQSLAFYEELAASLGFPDVTAEDTLPFRVGINTAGDAMYGELWKFWFLITGPDTLEYIFKAGQGRCGEPLRKAGNALLECVIQKLKPAYTDVIFSFGGS